MNFAPVTPASSAPAADRIQFSTKSREAPGFIEFIMLVQQEVGSLYVRTIVVLSEEHWSASSVTCAQALFGGVVMCCAISNQNILCCHPQVAPPPDVIAVFTSSSLVFMLLRVLADSLAASFVYCSTFSICWSMFPYPLTSYPFCASEPSACID